MGDLLWFVFRKDIGRKLTALGLAVAVWLILAHQLRDTVPVTLDVHVVERRSEAEEAAAQGKGLWVVVPPELILSNRFEGQQITVTVSGLDADVQEAGQRLAGVFEVSPEVLRTEVSGSHRLILNNPAKYRAGEVDIRDLELDFENESKRLQLNLSRRDSEVFDLGSENVQATGVPKEGWRVDTARISVTPNQVQLSGPQEQIETLRRDPSSIKLSPISVDGKGLSISRQVGLDHRRVDRDVELQTAGQVVTVVVQLVREPVERQLLSVPVKYENADALTLRGKRVVESTPTIDLLLRGPPSLLDGYTDEFLRKSITVEFDWTEASRDVANPHPRIKNTLPDEIRFLDLDGRQPEIGYTLEDVVPKSTDSTSGDTP